MAFRHALLAAASLGFAVLGLGASLGYYEESLPTTMNPLFRSSMVDVRSQELVFDRLWYNDAITNEDSIVWGDLYEDAMAAKTAHLCLVFSPSGDALARGIISAEPVGSSTGNRSYKFDYGSDDWWKQTPAGARYLALAAQAVGGDGMSASPIVCF